jgi:hypothetical protein
MMMQRGGRTTILRAIDANPKDGHPHPRQALGYALALRSKILREICPIHQSYIARYSQTLRPAMPLPPPLWPVGP